MKYILFICFVVQISLTAIAVAQITFTREWVTGKRSLPPTRKVILKEEHATSLCSRTFAPVIEFLIEEERLRKHECGSHLKISIPKSLSWIRPSTLEEISKTLAVNREDEAIQYDTDLIKNLPNSQQSI